MALNFNQKSASSASRSQRSARPSASKGQLRGGNAAGSFSASAGQPLRSTRIADINARPSKAQRSKGGRKAAIAAGVAAFLAAAALIAYVVLSATGAFAIKSISAKGVTHLTDQEMAQLANVSEGTTLLNVDADRIRQNLLQDAWVQSVAVNRIFPHTLELVVKERTIQAVIEVQANATAGSQQWAIASDGTWLMPIPEEGSEAAAATSPQVFEDAAAVMHVQNILVEAMPQIGEACTEENVNNALSIISGMSTELADQVKTIIATDADSSTLVLENGIEIAFGNTQNIRDKERVCLELMKQHEGSIAYINVRSVERPTWRSI